MKAIILLILSCMSLIAADTNVQVSLSFSTNKFGQVFTTERSVRTNRETGEVLTTETLTHEGQTNLVRTTRSERGAIAYRYQLFYHNGVPVAAFVFSDGSEGFGAFANSPYSASVDFSPSKEVRRVTIEEGNFHDCFYPTNGVFYPVLDYSHEMLNLE